MPTRRRFGVSTRLYHTQRLSREHLLEIAVHGFETVEVFATRTHFDSHNPAAVADLQQWVAEAGLDVNSVHAPVGTEPPVDVAEIEQALFIARRIPIKVFVTRLEGARDSARRTVARVADLAGPLGVKIAVEALIDDPSPPGSLVHFIEEELELTEERRADVGIGLDFGHAQKHGDLIDAIETVSEHLIAVHLPLDAAIDWPSALTTVQKIGYEGALIFDMAARGSARDTLARARNAREKMERWLTST